MPYPYAPYMTVIPADSLAEDPRVALTGSGREGRVRWREHVFTSSDRQ